MREATGARGSNIQRRDTNYSIVVTQTTQTRKGVGKTHLLTLGELLQRLLPHLQDLLAGEISVRNSLSVGNFCTQTWPHSVELILSLSTRIHANFSDISAGLPLRIAKHFLANQDLVVVGPFPEKAGHVLQPLLQAVCDGLGPIPQYPGPLSKSSRRRAESTATARFQPSG